MSPSLVRIAFYAPMKPPDHPTPSGDRRVARLLMMALERAGCAVDPASRLRSWEGQGDPARQAHIQSQAEAEVERLCQLYEAKPALRPELWFSYHLYYKAPDLVGPAVASRLSIPYIVAEASVAPKRRVGPWARWHASLEPALAQAAAVITLNPEDMECLPDQAKLHPLSPFLDATPYRQAADARGVNRRDLAERTGFSITEPWILAVGMMREGDKMQSYRSLAAALSPLQDRPWHLLICGDGPARQEVEGLFHAFSAKRICFLGRQAERDLPAIYSACNLMVWPGIREAFGMALLEAQAAGLPVISAARPGIAAIVRDGGTGLLCGEGEEAALSRATRALLEDPSRRDRMGRAALSNVAEAHDLPIAAQSLGALVRDILGRGSTI
ncbi:MAG: glycosyltransferase family 4 protein [Pseudomonadota bacterium]